MVGALPKTDRRGAGKLIDMVTRADQNATNAAVKADYAAKMTETTAKGVTNLTVSMQKQFDELRTGQETIMDFLRDKLP
jgi:hypothetical protein